MSADDTARALMAMEDPDVRTAVAAGRFEHLGGLDLEPGEQALLRAAATGEANDETTGFGAFAPPYVPVVGNIPLMQAVRYVEDRVVDADVRDRFRSFTGRVGAQGTW